MARTSAKNLGVSQIGDEKVLLWKATLPLSTEEHEQLSNKLRFESEKSGVKIILVPFSVEATTQEMTDPVNMDNDENTDLQTSDPQSGDVNEQ